MSDDGHLQIGRQRIQLAGQTMTIPGLAFLLMLAGVLLPSAMYSFRLQDPTPAELLVAICIALFSSVVFLWILDATAILKFRSEWVSKSIYGAAIVSVLGTSVAVYKDAFAARKYAYEGPWELQITGLDQSPDISRSILLIYSEQSETYWGYSDFQSQSQPTRAAWLKVIDFGPRGSKADININVLDMTGQEKRLSQSLLMERKGRLFTLSTENGLKIRLSRPN
jgi:hypothetical protein